MKTTREVVDLANSISKRVQKLPDNAAKNRGPFVWMYIDEVHELTIKKDKTDGGSPTKRGKADFDYLLEAMTSFRNVFFILLSTQSDMMALTPNRSIAPSSRYVYNFDKLIPPFSETPFDVFKVNDPSKLHFCWVKDPIVMASWGRPL